jgi:DNA-binding LacI/PurR family transcriptional regulator
VGSETNGSGRLPASARIVTMRDIADAAGVSQSTVSRVLSGAASVIPIAEGTRARVLEVSDRLGYRPNPLARGLRGARTMLVGVIVREITDPFFAGAIDVISAEASARGYNVVLGHAHGRADEAIALRAVLETRHVDAIMLLGDTSEQPRLLEDLRATHVPVVALWHGTALPGIASVNVDNRAGVTDALDHLWGLGHRSMAFIGGRSLGDIHERRATFVDYVTSRGASLPATHIQHASNDPAEAAEAMETLMRLPSPPTAVVASTDQQAIGALHGAFRARCRVPDDVSIVGFDDIPMAAYTVPALTTIRMPMAQMASAAIRFVIDVAPGQPAELALVLRPTLVVRGSTGPVPGSTGPGAGG